MEALAAWASGAWYHYQNQQMIDVACDGAHLSAQGHDVLDIWISADSQRHREEQAERERQARQNKAKSQ